VLNYSGFTSDTECPFTPVQHCSVHKLANIASKLPRKAHSTCLFGVKKIYLAGSKKSVTSMYKDWTTRYSDIYPKAVEHLAEDIESMLTLFDYSKYIWKKKRSANAIERSFREE